MAVKVESRFKHLMKWQPPKNVNNVTDHSRLKSIVRKIALLKKAKTRLRVLSTYAKIEEPITTKQTKIQQTRLGTTRKGSSAKRKKGGCLRLVSSNEQKKRESEHKYSQCDAQSSKHGISSASLRLPWPKQRPYSSKKVNQSLMKSPL